VPVINHVKREINAKLVYVGPRRAGKRTSMALVHARLRPECRSDIRSMGSGDEELRFFDFLPREIGSVDGYHVRFHLYAVAAEEGNGANLRMVLKGVDGIMFVSDAAPGREASNRQALELVEEVLAAHGTERGAIPLVVQRNKRDLLAAPGAAADDTALFAGRGWDVVETDARQGEGVLAAVSLLVKKVMTDIRRTGVQVQEPELLPEEGDADDGVADEEAWASPACSPADFGAKEGGWRLAVPCQDVPERDGVLALPLLLTHSDGRRCRLTVTVGVRAEVE
jgi:signal recognition particle receptor subunit beta